MSSLSNNDRFGAIGELAAAQFEFGTHPQVAEFRRRAFDGVRRLLFFELGFDDRIAELVGRRTDYNLDVLGR